MSISSGINLLGPLSGAIGTIVATHALIDALLAREIPLAGFDCAYDPQGRKPFFHSKIQRVDRVTDLPYKHTIIVGVFSTIIMLYQRFAHILHAHRLATMVYWELPDIPPSWYDTLRVFDPIFVPTRFVGEAISTSVGLTPVVVPLAPLAIPSTAERLCSSKTDKPFQVLLSFDPGSWERKNPLAVLEAFVLAFPPGAQAELIVKTWWARDAVLDRILSERFKIRHPGIRYLHADLSRLEYFSLLKASDCYISLHRSEGLGLGMLEAMSYGKPVIATNYSGNTDYLDRKNGIPIPYELRECVSDDPNYTASVLGKQSVWAEPDIRQAAQALRQLASDVTYRHTLGKSAYDDFNQRRSEFLHGTWLESFFP